MGFDTLADGSGALDHPFGIQRDTYVKASNTDAGDRFGDDFALSRDGSTIAVGATFEDSAATGIGGNQTDNSALSAGAVYVLQ